MAETKCKKRVQRNKILVRWPINFGILSMTYKKKSHTQRNTFKLNYKQLNKFNILYDDIRQKMVQPKNRLLHCISHFGIRLFQFKIDDTQTNQMCLFGVQNTKIKIYFTRWSFRRNETQIRSSRLANLSVETAKWVFYIFADPKIFRFEL